MVLVAISVVSLLGMAALAIDVVNLYVARGEIQRAADAAALAGAHAIADSGATTLSSSDTNLPDAETLAQTMVNARIAAILPVNLVAGSPPTSSPATINWGTLPGNPTLTVSLSQSNVPTFFARIWGHRVSSVSATATAEVYNPANNSPYTPIAPMAVKPWLVMNADPTGAGLSAPFINLASNSVENGGAIGHTFDLTADCSQTGNPSACTLQGTLQAPPITGLNTFGNYWVYYLPACVAGMPCNSAGNTSNNICPFTLGTSAYENAIICADFGTTYTFPDTPYGCGSGSANWDQTTNPAQNGINSPSAQGTEVLINMSQGQDQINYATPFMAPFQITQGAWNLVYSGQLVSTSSSIVTIPIIDTGNVSQGSAAVTVVGFLQAFINTVQQNPASGQFAGDINITVLNIAGCSGSPNAVTAPVVGGSGVSPLPVRLIAPPTT